MIQAIRKCASWHALFAQQRPIQACPSTHQVRAFDGQYMATPYIEGFIEMWHLHLTCYADTQAGLCHSKAYIPEYPFSYCATRMFLLRPSSGIAKWFYFNYHMGTHYMNFHITSTIIYICNWEDHVYWYYLFTIFNFPE